MMTVFSNTILISTLFHASAFTIPHNAQNVMSMTRNTARAFVPGSALFMSDDQPSDSSTEATVDVESETISPTETDSVLSSLKDAMPTSLMLDVSADTRSAINEAILKLEALSPEPEPTTSSLLNGVWTLKYVGGYSAEGALASPTRQLALFLYSGGYSPAVFGLSLAQAIPGSVVDTSDVTVTICREQPRIEGKVGVTVLNGSESDVVVSARLDVKSGVRFSETYESATVAGQSVEIPEMLQYSRELIISYLDSDILIVKDASGVPEILVRKEYGM